MISFILLTYLQFSVTKWAKQRPGQNPIKDSKSNFGSGVHANQSTMGCSQDKVFDIMLTYCGLSYNLICMLKCLELWWQSNRHRHVKGGVARTHTQKTDGQQHIWQLCQKHANTWRAHCTCIACHILLGVLGEIKDRKGPIYQMSLH
jgi:hypothetical protein